MPETNPTSLRSPFTNPPRVLRQQAAHLVDPNPSVSSNRNEPEGDTFRRTIPLASEASPPESIDNRGGSNEPSLAVDLETMKIADKASQLQKDFDGENFKSSKVSAESLLKEIQELISQKDKKLVNIRRQEPGLRQSCNQLHAQVGFIENDLTSKKNNYNEVNAKIQNLVNENENAKDTKEYKNGMNELRSLKSLIISAEQEKKRKQAQYNNIQSRLHKLLANKEQLTEESIFLGKLEADLEEVVDKCKQAASQKYSQNGLRQVLADLNAFTFSFLKEHAVMGAPESNQFMTDTHLETDEELLNLRY